MRGFIAFLSVICLLFSVDAAVADKRVAFVVGNGAYANVTRLSNTPMEAKAMTEVLRNVGFDVVEGTDLTRDEMAKRLLEFGNKAQGADIAVFFYSGYGIAIAGTNYLLPIDADIKSEADVKRNAGIDMDEALGQTMAGAKVKLVFLDACYDDPFVIKVREAAKGIASVQSGLAEMKSGEGTLVAFATGCERMARDGSEGVNSPFTRALIDNITQPGVEIQQAMTRVGAEISERTNKDQSLRDQANLTGPVYLNPAPAETSAAVAPAVSGSDVELEFWRSVKDSKKADELNAYLTRYPNGQFKSLALGRIASLDNDPVTTPRNLSSGTDPETFTEDANQTTEDQLGLDRGQRRDVQRRLTGLGFDTKPNGKFDEAARVAIVRWQVARGYPATGFLNKLQHQALLGEIVATTPTSASDGPDGTSPRRHHGGGGGDRPNEMIGMGSMFRSSGGGHYGCHPCRGGGGGPRGGPGEMMGGLFRTRGSHDSPSDGPPPRDSASTQPNPTPPEPVLPDFPWPPPAPSTYYVLPDDLLRDHSTVGRAADAIISALERTGYVERTFFRTKPGGVALVTRLERIEPDGRHVEPDRWSASEGQINSAAGLAKFLSGLFFAEKGHYRLIVFILQDSPFIPSSEKMTEVQARGLISQGANILPAETRSQPFSGSYCTVLIYEFASDGATVSLVKQSPLTARQHLEKAGVLSLLGKPG